MSTILLDRQTEMIKIIPIFLLLAIISTSSVNAFATSDEYHQGYETGCDDSTSSDRTIKQSDGLTEQFKLGYEHGYLECSGFDRSTFDCGEGSNGCNGLVYCSKIESDVPITCYDETD